MRRAGDTAIPPTRALAAPTNRRRVGSPTRLDLYIAPSRMRPTLAFMLRNGIPSRNSEDNWSRQSGSDKMILPALPGTHGRGRDMLPRRAGCGFDATTATQTPKIHLAARGRDVAMAAPFAVFAQDYPNRPITL